MRCTAGTHVVSFPAAAVCVLCLCRDFFLMPANYAGCRSLLVARFGELLRKLWNRQNFKGQVSPHEFMQASDMSQALRNASHQKQAVLLEPVLFLALAREQ
jgi:U4/U6.U5 tri-snRNP-associated protein 2